MHFCHCSAAGEWRAGVEIDVRSGLATAAGDDLRSEEPDPGPFAGEGEKLTGGGE